MIATLTLQPTQARQGEGTAPVGPTEGRTFLEGLARRYGARGPPGTSERIELSPRTKPYVVLLVDDEQDILESLRAALETSLDQVRVQTASTGLEALHIMERVPVDLVVTDFKMPGMDGFELLERAERIAPGLPRILMSAFVYDVPRASVERSHVDCFLPKPFGAEELVRAVATTLSATG